MTKRLIMAATDLVVMPFALWAAFALRLGEVSPAILIQHWWLWCAVPALSLPLLYACGMYRSVIRFMGTPAVLTVLKGAALSVSVFVFLAVMLRLEEIPRSSYVLYGIILVGGLGGTRFGARLLLPKHGTSSLRASPVLIYGAGMAGIQLAEMLNNGQEYRAVTFIDDDTAKQGTEILGLPVRGVEAIDRQVAQYGIEQILLAMPTATRSRRREIIASLEPLPVHVRTVPGLIDIVTGAAKVDELREVDTEDLLGREPVPPVPELLDNCISGRSVMVTGAGGSIGGELCRQILQRKPQRIVLYEQSEFSLYRIERELVALARSQDLFLEIIPVLGSVLDAGRVTNAMSAWNVESVYHAAAYKHVPLVEANPAEGVRNNAFGTLVAARAAVEAGVGIFVLISTDKAVNPTNVMGASKRVAELILQALAESGVRKPVMSIVRFGNVLDSSGSVVPLFRSQIHQGGPVTVTHPEVIRYFMTIPEAALLVLQASALAEGGEVFVLDMGKPVAIVELARRMINLSGLEVRDEDNPDGDIEIEFTGLRPGEKLYEELLIGDNVSPTAHEMIQRAREAHLDWIMLEKRLEVLERLCTQGNEIGIRRQLGELVDGYDGSPVVVEHQNESGSA